TVVDRAPRVVRGEPWSRDLARPLPSESIPPLQTKCPNLLRASGRASRAAEIDDELETESLGDAMKRVEIRRDAAGFEPCEGRLRTANAGRQLSLRQAAPFACLPDPLGDFEGFLRSSIAGPS